MEIAVLVLVLAFVVCGMTVMLAAGYANTEKERERQAQRQYAAAALKAERLISIPRGFFQPSRPPAPVAFVFDDGLVHELETHVRNEQALIEDFVHQPSVDNLYRQRGVGLQLQ